MKLQVYLDGLQQNSIYYQDNENYSLWIILKSFEGLVWGASK